MTLRTAAQSPAIQRGLVAIVGALAVLAWPNLFGSLLFFLVGVAALIVGLIELRWWAQTRDRAQLFKALALIAVAGAILLGPKADRYLENMVAGLIGLQGLRSIYVANRDRRKQGLDPFWGYARGSLWIALGLAIALIPEQLLSLAIVAVAASWIVGGVIVLINAIGEDETNDVPDDVVGVIRSNSMESDLRQRVTEAIFEGWDSTAGTLRFAALMSFATAIATFGVKANSTAVVIGAMLIAPLMSPIMALSASVLMGWPKRAGYSGWRVTLGVAIGVGGSFLLSLFSPDFVAITANSEVLSRVSPTTLDLLIALAAGAAGGYAVTHPEVSNSLPGVAIAVALAPPLAVVGVSLEAAQFAFAGGAFLLFLTNLVGIVVASGVTYIFSGYSPWTHLERSGEQGRKALVLVGIALVLVSLPLALIGESILDAAGAQSRAQASVEEWLGSDTPFAIARVTVNGENVKVVVVGPGDTPEPQELADTLAGNLKRTISLELDVIPERHFAVTGDP